MTSNMQLLNKVIECLINNLGLVEAERFISLINLEKFDYTEWKKEHLFNGLSIKKISCQAIKYRKSKKQ